MKRSPVTLVSGEARHAEYPTTFAMPPLRLRQRLKPGWSVKLMFASGTHEERCWVLVTGKYLDGYEGTMLNTPILFHINLNKPVRFQAEHVIDIDRTPVPN